MLLFFLLCCNIVLNFNSVFGSDNTNALASTTDSMWANTVPYVGMPELVQRDGYPVETHSVVTKDGYNLTMHRIPSRQVTGSSGHNAVVLLQHGLFGDSSLFVVRGAGHALAYLLADRGFDVWMSNSRGNRYSRRHVTLSPDSSWGEFWKFSWHEMGVMDLPAVIDYILDTTHQPNLIYVGHSQGTTQFLVLGSERPEYERKIKAMFGLAPVIYFDREKSPLTSGLYNVIIRSLRGRYESFGATSTLTALTKRLCATKNHLALMGCVEFMYTFLGASNDNHTDLSMFPLYFTNFPSSAATNQVIHFEQLLSSGAFRQFDYGYFVNLQKYGSIYPPSYNLQNIMIPITFYYSLTDNFSTQQEDENAFSELGCPVNNIQVPSPEFNHMDFFWAKDVKELLYDDLIQNIELAINK